MKKILMVMLSVFFVAGVTTNAHAILLNPGDTVNVTNAAIPAGTLLTSQDIPFSSTAFSGMSHQAVYSNSTGMLFVYSFDNSANSLDPITRMTTTDFTGWTVSADASLVGDPTYSIDRTGSGGSIGFGFKNGDPQSGNFDPGVQAGNTSSVMWIQTNANEYKIGALSFIDGDIAHIDGYAPNNAVPEPMSLSLMGLGLVGLVSSRIKKKIPA